MTERGRIPAKTVTSANLVFECRQIRYFIAAAEHGSFRKAGLSLGIRESSISRRVRELEERLGAQLFTRDQRGARLNLAGQRFLIHARSAIRSIDDGIREVANIGIGNKGHLRIGIFLSFTSGFLKELLRTISDDSQGLTIDLTENSPVERMAAVRRQEFDIIFVMGSEEHVGCETAHLPVERLFVVLPFTHFLASRPSLAWADLAGETFIISAGAPGKEIYKILAERLSILGHEIITERQDVGRESLMSLVAIGRGVTLISEAATSMRFPGVVYRQVDDETLPLCAMWSSTNDNPALQRLLTLARERCSAATMAAASNDSAIRSEHVELSRTPGPSP